MDLRPDGHVALLCATNPPAGPSHYLLRGRLANQVTPTLQAPL